MRSNSLSLISPAKLNLFLHINGRREDGYHELQTLFQFLSYGDQMVFSATPSRNIILSPDIAGLPTKENLIYRAAKLLQDQTGVSAGAHISIDKVLPMGGGIGGGSSNAATTLLALNYLWQTELSIDALATLGLQLGADVPIFVHGFAAIAEGVGEILEPTHPPECWYLVSKPDVSISTAEIFNHPDLPRNTPKVNNQNLDLSVSKNDCENLVLKHYPEVAKLRSWLLEYAPSKLTGTGACIFSQFNNEADAKKVQSLLPENIESFVAKGCNRSPLHEALEAL